MPGDERSIPRGGMAVVVEVVHPLGGRVDELHVGLDEDLLGFHDEHLPVHHHQYYYSSNADS